VRSASVGRLRWRSCKRLTQQSPGLQKLRRQGAERLLAQAANAGACGGRAAHVAHPADARGDGGRRGGRRAGRAAGDRGPGGAHARGAAPAPALAGRAGRAAVPGRRAGAPLTCLSASRSRLATVQAALREHLEPAVCTPVSSRSWPASASASHSRLAAGEAAARLAKEAAQHRGLPKACSRSFGCARLHPPARRAGARRDAVAAARGGHAAAQHRAVLQPGLLALPRGELAATHRGHGRRDGRALHRAAGQARAGARGLPLPPALAGADPQGPRARPGRRTAGDRVRVSGDRCRAGAGTAALCGRWT